MFIYLSFLLITLPPELVWYLRTYLCKILQNIIMFFQFVVLVWLPQNIIQSSSVISFTDSLSCSLVFWVTGQFDVLRVGVGNKGSSAGIILIYCKSR